jgi:hypothetical protein
VTIAIGALVVVVAIGVAVALGMNRAPGSGTAAPQPGTASPTAAAPTTAAPTTPVEEPTQSGSPSATPTSSSTKTVRADTPYCRAYNDILAGGKASGVDEGTVDLDALAKKFDELIGKYTAASADAPAKLAPLYDTVIDYLKDMRKAAGSGDLGQIREMLRNLTSLNDTMSEIDRITREVCA